MITTATPINPTPFNVDNIKSIVLTLKNAGLVTYSMVRDLYYKVKYLKVYDVIKMKENNSIKVDGNLNQEIIAYLEALNELERILTDFQLMYDNYIKTLDTLSSIELQHQIQIIIEKLLVVSILCVALMRTNKGFINQIINEDIQKLCSQNDKFLKHLKDANKTISLTIQRGQK
ncbi:MAG: hypothetical protein ACE364_09320 [Chlorobiota bacterium]